MTGRQSDVILAIADVGYGSDGPSRNDLADEDHPSAKVVAHLPANVEAKIDLLKIVVKRNRDSENSGIEEAKSHQAYENPAVPKVQLCPRRNVVGENFGCDLIVQHQKMLPLRREEHLVHSFQMPRSKVRFGRTRCKPDKQAVAIRLQR